MGGWWIRAARSTDDVLCCVRVRGSLWAVVLVTQPAVRAADNLVITVELCNSDRQSSLVFTHPRLRSYVKTKSSSDNMVLYRW